MKSNLKERLKDKKVVLFFVLVLMSISLIGCSRKDKIYEEIDLNGKSHESTDNDSSDGNTAEKGSFHHITTAIGNYTIDIDSKVEGHPNKDAIFETSDTWKDTDTTETEWNVNLYFYDHAIEEDVPGIFQYDSFESCDTINTSDSTVYYKIEDHESVSIVHYYLIQDEDSYMRVDASVVCRFDESGSSIDKDVDLQDYVDQMTLWESLKITVKKGQE